MCVLPSGTLARLHDESIPIMLQTGTNTLEIVPGVCWQYVRAMTHWPMHATRHKQDQGADLHERHDALVADLDLEEGTHGRVTARDGQNGLQAHAHNGERVTAARVRAQVLPHAQNALQYASLAQHLVAGLPPPVLGRALQHSQPSEHSDNVAA